MFRYQKGRFSSNKLSCKYACFKLIFDLDKKYSFPITESEFARLVVWEISTLITFPQCQIIRVSGKNWNVLRESPKELWILVCLLRAQTCKQGWVLKNVCRFVREKINKNENTSINFQRRHTIHVDVIQSFAYMINSALRKTRNWFK